MKKNIKKIGFLVAVVVVLAVGVITVCGGGVEPGVGTDLFMILGK